MATRQAKINRLLTAPRAKLVYAAAGGGVRLAEWLYTTPGASRLMLHAVLPYSPDALADVIYPPTFNVKSAVSEETVRAMLCGALNMADNFLEEDADELPMALVVTAALATDHERRGEDHAWYALEVSGEDPMVGHLTFDHALGRDLQETALSAALLDILLEGAGA